MKGLFQLNGNQIIPQNLLIAISGFEGFKLVHLEYWRNYGGAYGFCTYQSAFYYLVEDLEEHGLPVAYSSWNSFSAYKSRLSKVR